MCSIVPGLPFNFAGTCLFLHNLFIETLMTILSAETIVSASSVALSTEHILEMVGGQLEPREVRLCMSSTRDGTCSGLEDELYDQHRH